MRVRDKLAAAVEKVAHDRIWLTSEIVDAVLDELIDTGLRNTDGGWTLKAERWLRDIRNGMR